MRYSKEFYHHTLYGFSALVLGIIYTCFLSLMPNSWFRDRDNYLVYANSAASIIDGYKEIGILFFNEPIFLYSNVLLERIIHYEYIPNIFVLMTSSVFFFLLVKYAKNFLTLMLGLMVSLVLPYLIQGELVALRQGIATSIFALSFFYIKDNKKIALVLFLCAFIHSIFFLFLFFWVLNFIFLEKMNFNKKLLLNFLSMMVFSFVLLVIAEILGLRQGAEYQGNVDIQNAGGAFVLFLVVFIYLYFYGNQENTKLYEFSLIGLVIFLAAYFLSPIAGRFLNTVAPFMIFLLVSRSTLMDLMVLVGLFFVFSILFINGSYMALLEIPAAQAMELFSHYVTGFFNL